MKKSILAASLFIVILSTLGLAGPNWDSKGAIYVLPHTPRTCSEDFPIVTDCDDIITTQPGSDVDVFPVFYDLDEYREFTYAISWVPLDVIGCPFTGCSDYTSITTLWPGESVTQTWNDCLPGPMVVTGWFHLQGDWGYIYFTGPAYVVDCDGLAEGVCGCHAGGFGGEIGDDPCEPCCPSGAESGTWGDIKAMFR